MGGSNPPRATIHPKKDHMKYIVYHGAVTPDNADASEGRGPYTLDIVNSEAEVVKLRQEYEDSYGNHNEASHPVFRVFQGEELTVTPNQVVTTWKLSKKK